MKQLTQSLIISLLLFPATIFSQHLVKGTYIDQITAASITLSGITVAKYDVKFYKIQYNTKSVHGNPTVASGMIAVPQSTCDYFPMLAYTHGTVLKKDDVPSRNNQEALIGKVFASRGYISVMPDYLGLGDNPGLHPYVHAKSEATATIDMIRASREFLAKEIKKHHNGQLFLTGYSQGGHAAMATYKYIQDNNLTNEFNVVGTAPASGPYNMSGSQSRPFLDNKPYSNPGYIVYLLKSYELAYGTIYNSLSDVLKPPYDTSVDKYFDGTYNMAALNAILPQQLDQLLTTSFLNAFKNDSVNKNHPLWKALIDNNNYDWKPGSPMRMYYCTGDEQVNFKNALDAQNAMTTKGATNVKAVNKGIFNHAGCVIPSLREALSFFDTLATPCAPVGISTLSSTEKTIQVYPTPFNEAFQIATGEMNAELIVYDIYGKVVLQNTFSENTTILTKNWAAGVYIVRVKGNENIYTKTIVKKN